MYFCAEHTVKCLKDDSDSFAWIFWLQLTVKHLAVREGVWMQFAFECSLVPLYMKCPKSAEVSLTQVPDCVLIILHKICRSVTNWLFILFWRSPSRGFRRFWTPRLTFVTLRIILYIKFSEANSTSTGK